MRGGRGGSDSRVFFVRRGSCLFMDCESSVSVYASDG